MITFQTRFPLNLSIANKIRSILLDDHPRLDLACLRGAIAAGFGFDEVDTFRDHLMSNGTEVREILSQRFVRVLRAQGEQLDTKDFYRAIVKAQIQELLKSYQTLSADEFRYDQTTPEKLVLSRSECLEAKFVDQVLRALCFIDLFQPTGSVNRNRSTYKIKHIAEEVACAFPEGGILGPYYISSSAVTFAALVRGFEVVRAFDSGIGCFINICDRELSLIDQRIRLGASTG